MLANRLSSLHTVQGAVCQDVGKENVPDTPQPKRPRMPRPKKASTVGYELNGCVGIDRY